jgi:uncharacterized protein
VVVWDPEKERRNVAKHRVSFTEAATVFGDPLQVVVEDRWHSAQEDRFRVVGMSDLERLLVVIFVLAESTTIRLISARRPTRR